jgi:hypothetical protein
MSHHTVRRHIALVAHDNKKAELLSWAEFNRETALPTPDGLSRRSLAVVLPQRSSGDGNGALRSFCICISMRDS